MHAYIKYRKANIKSAIGRIRRGEHLTGLADGRVRVPRSSYLNHPCPGYDTGSVLYFAGLIIASVTRNERYHEFYAVFFLIQTTVVSFLIFQTLV